MSHNNLTTIDKVHAAIADMSAERSKAIDGNKAAATRARVHANTARKLLLELRVELKELQ
jgi:hypothetical protein